MRRSIHSPRRLLTALLACWLVLAAVAAGQTPALDPGSAPEGLALVDVLRLVLENDPNIALAYARVASAEGSLLAAESDFDLLLSANFDAGHSEIPLSETTATERDDFDLGAGLNMQLRNSLSLSSGVDFSRTDPAGGATISNTATVFFSLRQPLLRGRGQEVATASERSARRSLDAEALDLSHTLSTRLLLVTTRYWQLEASRRRLQILRDAEDISRRILSTTQRLIEADLTPAAERIQLEADLSSRTTDRLAAEQALFAARQNLGLEIGLDPGPIRDLPLPSTAFPRIDPDRLSEADLDAWIDFALHHRADLAATRERLESSQILLAAAEDGLEPRLDLTFRPSYTGLVDGSGAGDFISPLYENVPGISALVSLSYSLPIQNRGAEAAALQRRAARESSALQLTLLRRTISVNAAIAFEAVRRNAQQLEQIIHSAELFRKTLENEEKKLQAGSSTLIDVITQRNRLTGAQQQQVAIELALALAIADLRFQTGTLLDATQYDPQTRTGHVRNENLTTLPELVPSPSFEEP